MMPMHSVLFFAKTQQTGANWGKFLTAVSGKLLKDQGAIELSENVWLLNVTKSPASLGLLIHTAENCEIPYGILPFDSEPQWLPVGFDPK